MTALLLSARAIHFGSGLVLVSVVAFRWLVLLPAFAGETDAIRQKLAPLHRKLHALFLGAALLLVISGAGWFWAVAAGMSETSLGGALNRETVGTVWTQTQFGHVCQWRLGLVVILGLIIWRLARGGWNFRRTPSPLEIFAGLIAIALLTSIAGMGHAAATGGPQLPWHIAADGLHLFAASIWPTGLLPFALFLSAARKGNDLSFPPSRPPLRDFPPSAFLLSVRLSSPA